MVAKNTRCVPFRPAMPLLPRAEDHFSTDLASDVLVGEAHDQTVLVGVVFVLVLLGQAEPGAVVGLSCSNAAHMYKEWIIDR